jgi:hypothetical protein
MSVSNTVTKQVFTGNGVTTAFAIPFALYANTQIKVKLTDTVTGNITILSVGTHYTISGGDPGTTVNMITAPASTELLTVYRATSLQQTYDFLNNTTVNMENVEKAMDYIVMMAQELDSAISDLSVTASSQFQVQLLQSLAAAATITIGVDIARQILPVQGASGAITTNTTTAIDNGTIDGQELVIRGAHATYSVTLSAATTNLDINGDMVLVASTTIYLVWDNTNSKWVEVGRSN